MLPFQPEPDAQLRKRFPKALEKVWVVPDDLGTMADRPGLHREQVFDFENGLRLLISKDKLMKGIPEHIHVSASWEHNEPQTADEMTRLVMVAYYTLGGKGHLRLLGISSGGVPHWVVTEVH